MPNFGFVSTNTVALSEGTGTVASITVPSAKKGELVYISVCNSNQTASTPTGFTVLHDMQLDFGGIVVFSKLNTFYKFLDGTEGTTFTCNFASSTDWMVALGKFAGLSEVKGAVDSFSQRDNTGSQLIDAGPISTVSGNYNHVIIASAFSFDNSAPKLLSNTNPDFDYLGTQTNAQSSADPVQTVVSSVRKGAVTENITMDQGEVRRWGVSAVAFEHKPYTVQRRRHKQ